MFYEIKRKKKDTEGGIGKGIMEEKKTWIVFNSRPD